MDDRTEMSCTCSTVISGTRLRLGRATPRSLFFSETRARRDTGQNARLRGVSVRITEGFISRILGT